MPDHDTRHKEGPPEIDCCYPQRPCCDGCINYSSCEEEINAEPDVDAEPDFPAGSNQGYWP